MTLTRCQDHILTENIWFVWSETSYSGDERKCHGCGTNKEQRTLKSYSANGSWRLSFATKATCKLETRIGLPILVLCAALLTTLSTFCSLSRLAEGSSCGSNVYSSWIHLTAPWTLGWIISDILIPNGLLTHFTVVSMLCYSCRDVITSCRAAPVALIPRYAGYGWFKLIQIYNQAFQVLHSILSFFSYTITNTNNDNSLLFTRQTSEISLRATQLNWSQKMGKVLQTEEEHWSLLHLPCMVQNMSK